MPGACHLSAPGATPIWLAPDPKRRGSRSSGPARTGETGAMHAPPLILEPATDGDAEPIERLNERVFGPGRFARTAYRIRETTDADATLSFVARVGPLLVGAPARTPMVIGEASGLLLGPLIVEPVFRSQGIGEALVTSSLEAAKAARWKRGLLVGHE